MARIAPFCLALLLLGGCGSSSLPEAIKKASALGEKADAYVQEIILTRIDNRARRANLTKKINDACEAEGDRLAFKNEPDGPAAITAWRGCRADLQREYLEAGQTLQRIRAGQDPWAIDDSSPPSNPQ